jgi:hypothetical protein
MGWNTIGEFANMGQIHLRTHLEEPEFQGCNKRSQDQDVSAPEIDPASLSPIVVNVANLRQRV